jgi:hypothetical protein
MVIQRAIVPSLCKKYVVDSYLEPEAQSDIKYAGH